jgi:hypothetical protein
VLLLLLWKTALESMLQKNSFHTRKKFRFSMTTRVRSWLAYPEDAPFPIYFLFSDIATRHGAKSIRRSKRVAARKKKKKNRNKIKTLQKI